MVSNITNSSTVALTCNSNDVSAFKPLPIDLHQFILMFSNVPGILSMRQVSHHWNAILETPTFWANVSKLLREPSVTGMQQLKSYTSEVRKRAKISTTSICFGGQLTSDLKRLKTHCRLTELYTFKKIVDDLDAITFCIAGLKGSCIDHSVFNSFDDVHSERVELAEWCKANQEELSQRKTFKAQSVKITTVPVEFNDLKNLEVLNLFSAGLTKLPINLDQMTKLREIHLGGNSLTLSPEEFNELKRSLPHLKNLEFLDLSLNDLSENQIAEIKKLLDKPNMFLNI